MNSRMRTVTMAGAATLGLLAGGEARAQVPAQEVYQLEAVSGQALPVMTEETGECRDELLGATLTLEADGRWLLITRERETCGETVEEEDREDGRYTLDGAGIRFLDDDGNPPEPDGDDDAEVETDDLVVGTRSDTGLVVSTTDGETELQFRR